MERRPKTGLPTTSTRCRLIVKKCFAFLVFPCNLPLGEKRPMCFSAAANFVGSGAMGAIGVVILTRVKHRRELLFAALPLLFAIHQFIEGFVWLGLDGIFLPPGGHGQGGGGLLFAPGLVPFLLPLSV